MYRMLFVLVAVTLAVDGKKLASYFKTCRKDDPNLNECAKKHGIEAIPFILKGDKEYKIPVLTPLHLPEITIASGDNLNILFKDVVLFGLETVDFRDMNVDIPNKKISVVVAFSYVNLKAQYEMDGRILVLPLKGKGPANLTFDDIVVTYSFNYNLIKKGDGKEYMDPNIKPTVKYTLSNAHYYFGNLFNGDKLLGDRTNNFLNEHASDVNQDLGESVSQTISAIVTNIIQLVVAVVPFDEIFV